MKTEYDFIERHPFRRITMPTSANEIVKEWGREFDGYHRPLVHVYTYVPSDEVDQNQGKGIPRTF